MAINAAPIARATKRPQAAPAKICVSKSAFNKAGEKTRELAWIFSFLSRARVDKERSACFSRLSEVVPTLVSSLSNELSEESVMDLDRTICSTKERSTETMMLASSVSLNSYANSQLVSFCLGISVCLL